MVLKRTLDVNQVEFLSLSTDAVGKLDILWHGGDPLAMHSTQNAVFKQLDQVGFAGLL